ncbi:hypothetical protein [Helicobacter cinaedi]|uniref:hypothetical protein n=2 Tax=Helicobacter cinaedi TaxID=213 RepID=UPI000DA23E00|nr:hypothetical protein [Helicobacter cinaedi]
MKYFILIFIGLITLVIITSCGLIHTTEGAPTKEQKELMEKYGGIYVFDKAIRDEIIQREKEREEARQKVTLGDTFWEQIEAIDKNLPQILSNGCKYYLRGLSKQEYERTDLSPYKEKIKEYMGEEAFNKLQPNILLISFYTINENGVEKDIPIEFSVSISWYKTTYGLYGDEGAGFRFTETRIVGLGNFFNTFYLIDNKFIRYKEDRTKQNYKSSTKEQQ